MAQLSEIISSILHDMISAQHQANMYSSKLVDAYYKNGETGDFPPPAVAMGEIEIDLKYGIANASDQVKQYEIDYSLLDKTLTDLSLRLSGVIVTSTSSVVIQSKIENDPGNESPMSRLYYDKSLQRNFSSFLSRKLLDEFREYSSSLVDVDGNLKIEAIVMHAVKVGEENILYHEDLEDLFALPHGEEVRQKAKNSIHTAVSQIIPQLTGGISLKSELGTAPLDVVVSSEELSKLSTGGVHSLHFKISPRDLVPAK